MLAIGEYTTLISVSELTITSNDIFQLCTKEFKCYRITSEFIVTYSRKKKGGYLKVL